MDWSAVLCNLRPGEEWVLEDEKDLSTLRWISPTPPPTREEIKAHVITLIQRQRAGECDKHGYPATAPYFTKKMARAEVDRAEAELTAGARDEVR